jgi:hypothetical protein
MNLIFKYLIINKIIAFKLIWMGIKMKTAIQQ